eukprot:15435252-Alexandrium_andersonii.AAC.1
MPAKGAVILFKGDWAEFCHTLGFPNWASALRPCFKCCAGHDRLHVVTVISPLVLPSRENTAEDYAAACDRCERLVHLSSPAELAL